MSKETTFVLPLMAGLALSNQSHRLARCTAHAGGRRGDRHPSVGRCRWLRRTVSSGLDPAAGVVTHVGGNLGSIRLESMALSSARDLSWIGGTPVWRVVLGWAFIVTLGVTWLRASERRLVGVGLGWSALLVGVAVAIADKGGFGDRFLYWPMAGLSVVLGAVAAFARWLVPAFAIPAVLLIQLRLPDWEDDMRLWGASIRDVASPTNELSLGHAMTLEGRPIRAHVAFVGALAGQQMDLDACAGVVGSAMRAGMSRQAPEMGLGRRPRLPTERSTAWLDSDGCGDGG